MKICVLASGSRGNAAWIRSGKTAVLVDAGISFRALKERLAEVDEDLGLLKGVIITHEHSDHISGLPILQKKTGVPVFATPGTTSAIADRQGLDGIERFQAGETFRIGSLEILGFPVSHDAEEPVGVVVSARGIRLGLVTDLGLATRLVEQRLKHCQVVIVEANHDPRMLIEGKYEWSLKQRIQSRYGHLANEKAGELLAKIHHSDLAHVFLAHRSKDNNTPELQLAAAQQAIGGRGTAIHLTWQERPAEAVEI